MDGKTWPPFFSNTLRGTMWNFTRTNYQVVASYGGWIKVCGLSTDKWIMDKFKYIEEACSCFVELAKNTQYDGFYGNRPSGLIQLYELHPSQNLSQYWYGLF